MATSSITEDWLQPIVENLVRLPALSPSTSRVFLPIVDQQLRKLIQEAWKFQKRSKRKPVLSVESINLALSLNKKEKIYGLHSGHLSTSSDVVSHLLGDSTKSTNVGSKIVSLVDLAQSSLPNPPYLPDIHLHWLVVNGSQPQIPENPSYGATERDLVSWASEGVVSKHLVEFYERITGILLLSVSRDDSYGRFGSASTDKSSAATINGAIVSLRSESAIQDIIPQLCRFLFQQLRHVSHEVSTLRVLVRALEALVSNPFLSLQFHLLQLLPVLFTCIIGNKIGKAQNEEHWSLRDYSAQVMASICFKYKGVYPDLQARVIKTYLEALTPEKSLTTLYGGLSGMLSLTYFRDSSSSLLEFLVPQLDDIEMRLSRVRQEALQAFSSKESKPASAFDALNLYGYCSSVLVITRCHLSIRCIQEEQRRQRVSTPQSNGDSSRENDDCLIPFISRTLPSENDYHLLVI